MKLRVVLGGTFDPVHYGHLRIADRLRVSLGLSELALLPTAIPPHKPADSMTPVEHRVAMLRLSLKEFPALTLCELELTDTIAYTVNTLRTLREGPPVVDPVFVVGMDSVAELETWHDYRELLEEFDLIAIARPDHDRSSLRDCDPFVIERMRPAIDPAEARRLIEHEQLGRGGRIFPLRLPTEAVSSREIRRRTAEGEPLDDLVPKGVALYIQRHDLYLKRSRTLKTQTHDAVLLCVEAARDRKAEDIVALDLRGLSDVTDTFVICHGTSGRQVAAIVENIEGRLSSEAGRKPTHIEGLRQAEWVLLDYIDFVVHVFVEEKRGFYRLERLWGDAPAVPLPAVVDGAVESG